MPENELSPAELRAKYYNSGGLRENPAEQSAPTGKTPGQRLYGAFKMLEDAKSLHHGADHQRFTWEMYYEGEGAQSPPVLHAFDLNQKHPDGTSKLTPEKKAEFLKTLKDTGALGNWAHHHEQEGTLVIEEQKAKAWMLSTPEHQPHKGSGNRSFKDMMLLNDFSTQEHPYIGGVGALDKEMQQALLKGGYKGLAEQAFDKIVGGHQTAANGDMLISNKTYSSKQAVAIIQAMHGIGGSDHVTTPFVLVQDKQGGTHIGFDTTKIVVAPEKRANESGGTFTQLFRSQNGHSTHDKIRGYAQNPDAITPIKQPGQAPEPLAPRKIAIFGGESEDAFYARINEHDKASREYRNTKRQWDNLTKNPIEIYDAQGGKLGKLNNPQTAASDLNSLRQKQAPAAANQKPAVVPEEAPATKVQKAVSPVTPSPAASIQPKPVPSAAPSQKPAAQPTPAQQTPPKQVPIATPPSSPVPVQTPPAAAVVAPTVVEAEKKSATTAIKPDIQAGWLERGLKRAQQNKDQVESEIQQAKNQLGDLTGKNKSPATASDNNPKATVTADATSPSTNSSLTPEAVKPSDGKESSKAPVVSLEANIDKELAEIMRSHPELAGDEAKLRLLLEAGQSPQTAVAQETARLQENSRIEMDEMSKQPAERTIDPEKIAALELGIAKRQLVIEDAAIAATEARAEFEKTTKKSQHLGIQVLSAQVDLPVADYGKASTATQQKMFRDQVKLMNAYEKDSSDLETLKQNFKKEYDRFLLSPEQVAADRARTDETIRRYRENEVELLEKWKNAEQHLSTERNVQATDIGRLQYEQGPDIKNDFVKTAKIQLANLGEHDKKTAAGADRQGRRTDAYLQGEQADLVNNKANAQLNKFEKGIHWALQKVGLGGIYEGNIPTERAIDLLQKRSDALQSIADMRQTAFEQQENAIEKGLHAHEPKISAKELKTIQNEFRQATDHYLKAEEELTIARKRWDEHLGALSDVEKVTIDVYKMLQAELSNQPKGSPAHESALADLNQDKFKTPEIEAYQKLQEDITSARKTVKEAETKFKTTNDRYEEANKHIATSETPHVKQSTSQTVSDTAKVSAPSMTPHAPFGMPHTSKISSAVNGLDNIGGKGAGKYMNAAGIGSSISLAQRSYEQGDVQGMALAGLDAGLNSIELADDAAKGLGYVSKTATAYLNGAGKVITGAADDVAKASLGMVDDVAKAMPAVLRSSSGALGLAGSAVSVAGKVAPFVGVALETYMEEGNFIDKDGSLGSKSQRMGYATVGMAAGMAVGAGVAAVTTVAAAPLVAAVVVGYGISEFSGIAIEYSKESKRFDEAFNDKSVSSVRHRLGKEMVEVLKEDGAVEKDGKLTLKDGTELALSPPDKNGNRSIIDIDAINFKNPENIKLLDRALDKKIASTQADFDKTSTWSWWGDKLDQHKNAEGDLHILKSAKSKMPGFQDQAEQLARTEQQMKVAEASQQAATTKPVELAQTPSPTAPSQPPVETAQISPTPATTPEPTVAQVTPPPTAATVTEPPAPTAPSTAEQLAAAAREAGQRILELSPKLNKETQKFINNVSVKGGLQELADTMNLDKNDGLTIGEVKKSLSAALDQDGDGVVDKKHYKTFAQMDENRDGKISMGEIDKLVAKSAADLLRGLEMNGVVVAHGSVRSTTSQVVAGTKPTQSQENARG